VHIGQPIANTQTFVLDEHLEIVPKGVQGELYIGGDGLARGYLRQAELTAERFIPNPFSEHPGSRLYQTGDVARYLPDGNLEFLGRIDHQVKVRGYRIELGEIESVLTEHPAVREVVVVASDETGEKRLVAYLVVGKGLAPGVNELRSYLKERLPDYMVPSAFMVIDELPLTPNGKVDRRKLPAPEQSRPELEERFVAPRTPVEEMLTGIWCEVLGIEQVGVHDNFFALGGDSLLATRVIYRIRERCETHLLLQTFFKAPTVAELAAELLLADKLATGVIRRQGIQSLSFGQERLWFLEQLNPGSAVYNIPLAARLSTPIDVAALMKSIAEIVRRHEVLRTTFSTVDSQPLPIVSDTLDIDFPVIDLSIYPEDEREARARELINKETLRTFDLATGPLLRTTLLRLGEQDHVFLVTMHHIVSDGWSMVLFLNELSLLYAAFSRGEQSPIADLPIQYTDYAAWQRERLDGELLERQLAYWRGRLGGDLPVLDLPAEKSRPAVQTFRGARKWLVLSETQTESINALCRREGGTLFMTVLAAFKVLLHRYSGQEDIIVGSPIGARPLPETEKLIGFFLNNLALRTDLSGNPTFREVLARVRHTALEAFANQDVPFEKLIEELKPERDLSRTPFFQVYFNLFNFVEEIRLPGTTETIPFIEAWSQSEENFSKFDLTIYAGVHERKLKLAMVYNVDLFDDAFITRMLEHFDTLLAGITADPAKAISDFALKADSGTQHLSTGSHSIRPVNAFVEFKRDEIEQSITRRFEEQVKKCPAKLAVRSKNQEWSYEELNNSANRIARSILSSDSEEERVALLFEHDAPMIAAMLGVLKAGRTYVPLNTNDPEERLSRILDHSDSTVLLTNNQNLGVGRRLTASDMRLVNIDRLESVDCLVDLPVVEPDKIAYLLYTSGSTGQPKAVMQNHRNILHFTRVYTNNLHISSDDRLTLLSSYCFDAAVMDIYGALLNGATLVPIDVRQNGAASLSEQLRREQITIYHSTPTVYRYFLDTLNDQSEFPDLRLVVLGGEEVNRRDVELYQKHFSDECLFVNGFGPTEATVSLQNFINRQTKASSASVAVGFPVEDTEVLLLDEAGRPAEIHGEIAIKSQHVALGYWRDPEASNAAFAAEHGSSPTVRQDAARLYHTGDLGRRLPDGSIRFEGRKDFQIKIRGFRIELGEIESVLGRHSQVAKCVVVARETDNRDKQIVAYVVPGSNQSPNEKDLRSFLKQKLPEYMLPASFVMLDWLPLTASGKVDRRALPTPDISHELAKQFVPPRNSTEEIMVKIWQDVLDIDHLGVFDNFFELGGHSLKAMQVRSRVSSAFQVDVPWSAIFEAGNVSAMAAIIEDRLINEGTEKISGVSLTELALLGTGLNGAASGGVGHGQIPRRQWDHDLPLSFAQQRLWFLSQMEPESAAYNISIALRSFGPLNLAALNKAIDAIVARHEILRTSFAVISNEPVQVIKPAISYELSQEDLSKLPGAAQNEELRRIATHSAQSPFDLTQCPLFRFCLVRLSDTEHVLLFTIYHIIGDAWSLDIFARELAIFYRAFCQDQEPPLAELPIQYADYALWQRQWMQGGALEEQLGYWRERLHDAPTMLDLPTDKPRPQKRSFLGSQQHLRLSKEFGHDLRGLAQRENVTLFMVLLAAFNVLLYRYSSQDDILVGCPVAGRNQLETESLIGFFVNTLVIRGDLSGDPSFRELLRRTRRISLAAFANQDLPFEKIVQELQPPRSVGHSPFFQVMFDFHSLVSNDTGEQDWHLQDIDIDRGAARADLFLLIEEREDSLDVLLEYSTELFEPETIFRLLRHFEVLLEGAVRELDLPISQLPLLTEPERRQLLFEWKQPLQSSVGADVCLHQLFEKQVELNPNAVALVFAAQVERTPDAVAVVFDELQITYRELNERANQLAHYLKKLGVGPEVLVAICVDRSLEMVIGLLGILKAGGAYLPLDPAYPHERLSFIIEDARSPVLLTQARLVESLPSGAAARIVCLDRDWEVINRESADNPTCKTTPENLAYVIYTSGSTGKPKGVQICHSSLGNFLSSMLREPGICSQDVLLSVTTLSFDIAGLELYLPLIVGARVALVSREITLDGLRLKQTITTSGATLMQATPATWRLLIESGWQGCRTLKILCGGEALSRELADQLLERGGAIWNLYGPTETTIWSTACRVEAGGNVPLGQPIANTQTFVLDEQQRLVPVGVPGEIYIGGDGLARGYLRQAELTAERFVPHPFSREAGARLYRTGDLARYLANGDLEYLGRIDHQVKIRGYRIELGEIETVLNEHRLVGGSVVVAREDEPGEKRLVAYVIARENEGPSISELREYLKVKLPDYMVPSAFVVLDDLPLTANGKVDRQALPKPERTRDEVEGEYQAARTPVEEMMVAIWEGILGIEQVGIQDNFFELGGHSLIATRIVSRIRETFEVELPLRIVFERPTVAGLAERVEAAWQADLGLKAPALESVSREQDLPLSFAQQRLWFLDQLVPGTPVYNMPTAVRLRSALNIAVLERSLNEVVRRHEVLRTTISVDGGQPIQLIAPELKVALPITDLRSLPAKQRESEISRLAKDEAEEPFDLARGPLLRTRLLWIDQEEYVLLLTMHHLISDGWSLGILTRELSTLYEAYSAGQPSPLPELPIQYADYAAWQRGALQGAVLDSQLAYWKEQLAGAPTIFELPADRPRPPIVSFRAARQSLTLSNPLVKALRALSQGEGATKFMTLLAAFYVLLYRLTGQEDILVGSPIANRNLRETEDLIGLFLNNLVLRARLSNEVSFRALLKQVRSVALEAYSHQDVPFERLVEVLQPQRDLSRTPLFQILFNFFDSPDNRVKLCGAPLEALSREESWSQFDLTLYAAEQDETIQLTLAYNSDLFAQDRIAEVLNQFRHLLEQVVSDADKRISSYSLNTSWSSARLPDPTVALSHPYYEPITQTISAIANERPDHPAIRKCAESWSYRELSDQSDQIAQTLLSGGLKKGEVVAVSGPPSFGLVVGLLGVLKSGGVLLTLDRNLPSERQRLMIREAGARRLLYVGKRNAADEWLRLTPSLIVKTIGESGPLIEPEALAETELPDVDQNDPAYVFFTSGTTGIPKGILGCHKGLSHFLQWQRERFEVTGNDRCAQLTGLSFDVVLRDIFLPLTSGASLHLPDDVEDIASGRILSWLAREQISLLHTVPSLAELWLSEAPGVSLGSLRYTFFAGEPLTDSLVRRWRNVFPSSTVVNLYGPTETTLAKCFYVVPDDPPLGVQPVGQSLPETQALVLNRTNGICGIGEPGEIVIRTPFRTLGYINATEEQCARFIKNPFSEVENDLVYFTGDRGRCRPDGQLEILGRLDDQIKIRGVRVEPGEVNAVLASHPSVGACVVVPVKDEQGENALAAYVVSSNQSPLVVSDLRAHLERQLPAAMQPTYFVVLDELPLTPNGKVDRQALPKPERTRDEVEGEYQAARTPVEEMMVVIWAGILGIEQVGINDNFFELGGHSLIATRIVSRIREAFAVELPVRTLFESPTVAGLAERVEAAWQADRGLQAPALERVSREQELPLSFAQQRLWFLDQLEPNNPFYNVSRAIRLQGLLDTRALAQTIDTIISRHESLRTTFQSVDGWPRQVIADRVTMELPIMDLHHLLESERETEARRLATEEARQPFDLAEGPLMRASLVGLTEADHVLLLTMHHIISDRWSAGILIRELGTLYEAYSAGQPSPLQELSIQYADYAVWQKEWLQGEVLAKQLSYWREQLAGAPAALELPTDRLRPAVQTFRGAHHSVTVPKELSEQLKALAQREGVTLYMLCLAAFQVLMSRYSGQEDIVVGSPIAGRNRAETEGLIGFFVNMLVMRTSLSGDPSFRELLRRVREVSLGAYEHQDLPFEKLVEELQPERSLSYSPLFQVLFALQNAPSRAAALGQLKLDSFGFENRTTRFDLEVHLGETADGTLSCTFVHNTDLFDAVTVRRMITHYRKLLESVVTNPEERIRKLEMLTGEEREQLLVEWNNTDREYPREQTIHQLFEAQAERTPDAVAAVFNNEQITYRQLNERANQLAHYLQNLGVGPEVLVAICMDRSLEMVIGLLGILKAGGAYVTLDPSHPQERLSFIIEDARSPVLLTQERLVENLPSQAARIVYLDRDWQWVNRESAENPICKTTPENLAYVIYTSGSTGKPKGVQICHGSLSNFLSSMLREPGISSEDVLLSVTTLSFDIAGLELYLPLIVGARVVLVSREVASDGPRLTQTVTTSGATLMQATPATWRLLIETGWQGCETLKILCGGEVLSRELADQLLQRGGAVWNLYGPTETTIWSTACRVEVGGNVHIGRPIANTTVYILDRQLEPLPVGVPGELYIGGDGLARGYLNRPELTAERFISDPFSTDPGARLYRTGDVARYLPFGDIEYLGRSDHQVKIRGYRIELGEIEAVLSEHLSVGESVVVAREDVAGDKRLVAYVIAGESGGVSISEFREYLRGKLPDYMVPSAFVMINELPLTPNGKVDRRALPSPERSRDDVEGEYQAARTPVEEMMVVIWAGILGIEQVGINDNFFELGGHSLIATRIVSRIREAFAVELPLRTLFESPTVAGLAERVADAKREHRETIPAIRRLPRQ
jgi:amino acid adenylation domain-containing protein